MLNFVYFKFNQTFYALMTMMNNLYHLHL